MTSQPARTVIITGGNSGIGRGIAEAFAKENAQVVIIGSDSATASTGSDDGSYW